jgi:hypothetical protein
MEIVCDYGMGFFRNPIVWIGSWPLQSLFWNFSFLSIWHDVCFVGVVFFLCFLTVWYLQEGKREEESGIHMWDLSTFYFSSNSSLAISVMKWNSDTWRNFTSGSAQMFVKLNTNYAQKMGGFNNHALSWILQKKPNLTCFCCKIFQMHTFLQC